jgi:hypothetical protein
MKNAERKTTVFKYKIILAQQYVLAAVCSRTLFYLGGGAAIMWALGKTAFHDPNNRRL